MIRILIVIQLIAFCWGRPLETQSGDQINSSEPPTINPRAIWNMLNSVEVGNNGNVNGNPDEYERIEPSTNEFGKSPSSLYLIETYRLIAEGGLEITAVSSFSASIFEDITQIRLARPIYHHVYRLVLSRAVLKERYAESDSINLWVPFYNQELNKQVNKTGSDSIRICVSQKEKRKKLFCYTLDTTQLDTTDTRGHSWVGLDMAQLVRREMRTQNNKKHLYLYVSLSGCPAVNERCNPVSYLQPNYSQALIGANPRVPFVVLTTTPS